MGARAMHVLQSYGKPDPIFDGNAYTIVVTYDKEGLRLYSLHPTKPVESGSPVQYRSYDSSCFLCYPERGNPTSGIDCLPQLGGLDKRQTQ